MSRGVILLDSMIVRNQTDSLQSTYSFLVTSNMTPSLLVIASYVRDDKEIVADSLKLNVILSLQNQVSKSLLIVFFVQNANRLISKQLLVNKTGEFKRMKV